MSMIVWLQIYQNLAWLYLVWVQPVWMHLERPLSCMTKLRMTTMGLKTVHMTKTSVSNCGMTTTSANTTYMTTACMTALWIFTALVYSTSNVEE